MPRNEEFALCHERRNGPALRDDLASQGEPAPLTPAEEKKYRALAERQLFVGLVRKMEVGDTLLRLEDCLRCNQPTTHQFKLLRSYSLPFVKKNGEPGLRQIREWGVRCLKCNPPPKVDPSDREELDELQQ